MFKNILCPIDFSLRSRGAARVARALGRRFHSEIVPLHVTADADPARTAIAEGKLAEFVQHEFADCKISPCVVSGDPGERIVQFTQDRRIELIVMATHGESPFRKFELGSTASKVLYSAVCPVWTSPHLENWPAFDNLQIHSIVCAVDFGIRSCTAMNWASALAENFGARLTLAHAENADQPELWVAEREQTLRRLQERLTVPSAARILEGFTAPMLSELAEETFADLMVIGRTHAADTAAGAHAYTIIAHSPCPVLSV